MLISAITIYITYNYYVYVGLAADYYFDGIFDTNNIDPIAKRLVKRAFAALLELLQLCLVTTFNVDGRPPTATMKRRMKTLRTRSIRLLCIIELGVPQTFFAKYMHELLHVTGDCTARWGSARNFWSFFPER
jgi:hypothetical protein